MEENNDALKFDIVFVHEYTHALFEKYAGPSNVT